MDNFYSLAYATLAVIFMVPILAGAGYLVREQLRAQRNRQYKSLDEHATLNAADRETWMSGVLPEGEPQLDQFTGRILPLLQFVMLLVLVVVVVAWTGSLMKRIDAEDRQIGDLQLQLHALAFTPAPVAAPRVDADPPPDAAPTGNVPVGTPMQQMCANLIGRVADAYEKGESSKIGQSLEELVKRVGCEKQMGP